MYANNNFYGMNPYNQAGYGYQTQPARPAALMTNPVTEEEAKLLRSSGDFSLALSPTDKIKAKCTHRHKDNFAFVPREDGKVVCEICGTVWDPAMLSKAEVSQIIETTCSVIEQIKAMYLDLPNQTAEQYFTILPLLKKVPDFYEMAKNNFKSHEVVQPQITQNTTMGGFALYNNILGGGYNPMYGQMGGYPQQPYMPMQQPPMSGYNPQMGGYAPAQAPVYQPTAPMTNENPFASGMPQMPAMPMQQQPQMVPPVQPMMPTPVAPAPVAPQQTAAPATPQGTQEQVVTETAAKSFAV